MAVAMPQHKVLALAVFAALCSLPQAQAQEASPPAEEKEATTLATMTVTAQKREEAMQDVPIMLTALPEQLLQDTDIPVTDVAMQSGYQNVSYFIRSFQKAYAVSPLKYRKNNYSR